MFGYKKRLNLESYIIYLLMNDEIRDDHRKKFLEWLEQAKPKAKDASDLSLTAHNVVAIMAEHLASGGSMLAAHSIVWNYQNNDALNEPPPRKRRTFDLRTRVGNNEKCDEVKGASGEFGYEISNPIPADGSWYCSRLRCPNNHPYWYHRLGSVGYGPDSHMIDHVEMICFNSESHISLFFDMYHEGSTSHTPQNLTLDTPEAKGTMRGRVDSFPSDLQN